jgi:hypothetical protein
MYSRLQRPVTSQAIHLGMNFSLAKAGPFRPENGKRHPVVLY